jgi:hypothetical protein
MNQTWIKLFLVVVIAGACILSLSCARPPEARREEPAPPPETRSTPVSVMPRVMSNPPPPEPSEVNKAVRRVFRDAVVIHTKSSPYFMAGDFNGDLSQDIAVVVKPAAARLREINDQLANWILVDAKIRHQPRSYAEMLRVVVNDGDILLAVIHGYGFNGWRDDKATQTYVIKNAVGAGMRTEALAKILRPETQDRLPRVRGDVISQSIDGQPGFLYYNGAKYAWYDPRTYKPDALARTPHGRIHEAMR